jgi:hypothetical protein
MARYQQCSVNHMSCKTSHANGLWIATTLITTASHELVDLPQLRSAAPPLHLHYTRVRSVSLGAAIDGNGSCRRPGHEEFFVKERGHVKLFDCVSAD